ncbi:hypothetical protein NLC35_00550 [Candidatus Aminicenantes bacterium AC-334-K16]|nr:hypothetical protein [Candidatus Aminicenantes bacterium AC-334-K16]
MAKKLIPGILICAFSFWLLQGTSVLASPHRHHSPRRNFITFSWFFKPASLGLKIRLIDNFYATTNLDYRRSTNDLEWQVGSIYLLPRKILLFNFYLGGGYQFSRNTGYQFPYLTFGTNFFFLYSEVIYPLETRIDPKYRFGLSFRF